MKPLIKLAEAQTAEGLMGLYEHDGEYSIHFNGLGLMHSKANASECLLGELGMRKLGPDRKAAVLIGGLGLGFTLREVLKYAGSETKVDVVELIPTVIEWNRQQLKALNGALLKDERVRVYPEDVTKWIKEALPETYDVLLLDVDNGPDAMVSANNASLYSKTGVNEVLRVLKPGGRAVFWSSNKDRKFENRLIHAGFKVDLVPAKTHEKAKKPSYSLYVADKRK